MTGARSGPTKAARTRLRILDAAASVLADRGYAATRLTEIADRAELQAPAIYYHFGSREALIEEVVMTGLDGMTAHLEQVLDGAPAHAGPLDRLLIAVGAHLRHELELSAYTTAVIRNAGQLPGSIRDRRVGAERRYGDLWRGLLTEARGSGEIDAELEPQVALMLVLGSLNWAAEWWSPEGEPLDVLIASARTFVLAALGGD